jgi:L,D-transpeptidase YcbB
MRVIKDGTTVHAETIIVGKPSTPTPVFSADMKYVIFHPTWGVPDGIKMNEIAPSLRRSAASNFGWFGGGGGEPAVLRAHKLQVSYNGRPVNAASVNWETADIRNYQFTQPPSSTNVLGMVKFRFPNKHDVYMHDTPERALFSRADKAFSHGCMRVQNPRRLAEVLLAEDQGWSPARVGQAIAAGATQDVTLQKQVPVHVTYFTAVADDDGRIKTFGDLYGHDSRIASALEGKPIRLIAQTDPAVRAEREVRRTPQKRPSSGGSIFDLFSGLSGN